MKTRYEMYKGNYNKETGVYVVNDYIGRVSFLMRLINKYIFRNGKIVLKVMYD